VARHLQLVERDPQPLQGAGFHGLGAAQSHRTEFTFDTDHPELFASEDNGATPVEYVLVGLAGGSSPRVSPPSRRTGTFSSAR
jgi:hypothetical protein